MMDLVRRFRLLTCAVGAAAAALVACGGNAPAPLPSEGVADEPRATAASQSQACADIAPTSGDPQATLVGFETGPVFVSASALDRTYDNDLGWLWRFTLIIYPPRGVEDQTVTVSGRSVVSGAPMLFEHMVRPRAPGPLTLRTGGDNVTVSPVTGLVTEPGIYDITVAGDDGRELGTTRVAICSSFVVLGPP